eukprot:COSAG04_NODE_8564_length_957_cov_1.634033_1_plen_205_part_10
MRKQVRLPWFVAHTTACCPLARRLYILATHVMPSQLTPAGASASPQYDQLSHDLHPHPPPQMAAPGLGAAMLVPEPGTPAFQDWMRTLYDEGNRRQQPMGAAPLPLPGQSRCLVTLQDWLVQTESRPMALGPPEQEAMSRRLRIMSQHLPEISDPYVFETLRLSPCRPSFLAKRFVSDLTCFLVHTQELNDDTRRTALTDVVASE